MREKVAVAGRRLLPSLRTEESYVHRVGGFVRWERERRHPRERGTAQIQAFLSMLANERRVGAR